MQKLCNKHRNVQELEAATANISETCAEREAFTCEGHGIEDCGVKDEGQGIGIDGLGTEGPHVGAVCEVQGLWHNGCLGLVALQDGHGVDQVQFALALLVHGDARYGNGAFY